MWSTALCTLGVTKPMNLCNCLNFRQQHAGDQTVLEEIEGVSSNKLLALRKLSEHF